MIMLCCRAYLLLIFMNLYLSRDDFFGLYERVRRTPLHKCRPEQDETDRICRAIDLASIWYSKQVSCLQRSAATVCLLRGHGIAAEMVIGAQQMPFRSHAWVEVATRVVNDKPYIPQIYAELARC